tara:strand:+ start:2049 stop:2765 length:717 start_codon:yes stop_codon:yes gene_type:complete
MSKRCSRCKEKKEFDNFTKDKKTKDGFRGDCKECRRDYYKKNIKRRREYQRKYDKEHKKERTMYANKRRKTNPQCRMKSRLRARLRQALNGKLKSATTMELLGCDIDYFVNYIKNQLQPGMTLDNVEIDHMMPCASFDLIKVEEQKACFHYTNLQPLSKHENGSKGAKIVYDMIWRNNQWYIRDNPREIYRSRANILPVAQPVLNLSNNSVQYTLLDEITAMSKKIEERLNKINMLLL